MMEKKITSLADLQSEILYLKVKRKEQEVVIKGHFESPSAIFGTAMTVFRGNNSKSILGGFLNQDIITNLTRITLPLFLNKFVFRGSGFITKTIVAFLSQKAAKNIDKEVVTDVFEKAKNLFKGFTSKNKKPREVADYGIPPDSETY